MQSYMYHNHKCVLVMQIAKANRVYKCTKHKEISIANSNLQIYLASFKNCCKVPANAE